MDILLIGFGWIITNCVLLYTVRKNERLRKAQLQSIVREAHADATILELKADCARSLQMLIECQDSLVELNRWKQLAVLEGAALTTDRDRWQVECAKLRATVERQAGDIVRLETALKTALRGNAVRASNR